ncbi:uncharacterized protein LOC130671011 [Microplitis mediator]|uniref:uncharacterized protein LOC130666005 n=1 Tax=Microplitis mediator TaxID=375433 RepID=UPI002556EF10|nr:uncharacterized protein LOC130666005 [Microplitis mediator]XP_057330665.1 uncharacterized protein LOC130671011 [Microplitis mediator]
MVNTGAATGEGAANGEGAVTVVTSQRLPEFIASDPEMWFAMVESQFMRNRVTDKQMQYVSVLAALPAKYATEVRDIILKPLAAALYDELKEQLIKRLSVSQEENTRRLLEAEKIGDEKPSQYLRRLQAHAGSSVPDKFLKTLWLRGLPEKYQTAMATQQEKSVTAMAEVADIIYDILPARPTIAEASASHEMQLTIAIQQLRLEVAQLRGRLDSQVDEIANTRRGRSQTPHRDQSASRSRSQSRQRGPRPPGMCWYHWIFKEKADHCTSPCNWTPGNGTGSR